MTSCWDVVAAFAKKTAPTIEDYIALDNALDDIRLNTNMEKHLVPIGYSQKFCRYRCNYEGCDKKDILDHLKKHYHLRQRQMRGLRNIIDETERQVQKECIHAWERDFEARDHRSRYMCALCGAYR